MSISSSSLDSCPAFFKVYLPQLCSHHLQIPPEFESHIKGKFPQASTIVCSGGIKWNVEIQGDKDEDGDPGLFFKDGWSKFVKDNALQVGEFLVFYYDKPNSIFTVKVFSRSCCERKSKFNATANPVQFEVNQEATLDEEDTQDNNVKLNRKRKALASPEGCKPKDALENANAYEPEHPFFRATLNNTYIRHSFLHIPSKFWKSYLEGKSQAELECSGKSWKVGMYYQAAGRIGRGWPEFIKDNQLKVGDVCVFELVDLATAVFKVSIFRSNSR